MKMSYLIHGVHRAIQLARGAGQLMLSGVLPVVTALLLLLTARQGGLSAQPISCGGDADLPCWMNVEELKVQKSPPLFQFQARISQAKLPQGDTVFGTIAVKLLKQGEVVCVEEMNDVVVEGGALNLTIGKNMSCEVDEVIAENANMQFQVCLGGTSSCLKPVKLATVPFVLKAIYAAKATMAHKANKAGVAYYAHRLTADHDLYIRDTLGAGYFDFHTHPAAGAGALYTPEQYEKYKGGGFIQWTPARDPKALYLHILGKEHDSGSLGPLNDLVLSAHTTRTTGGLTINMVGPGPGLTVASSGLHVSGQSDFTGQLDVTGAVYAKQQLTVTQDMILETPLTTAASLTVTSGGLQVSGDSTLTGDLHVYGTLSTAADLHVTSNALFDGDLSFKTAQLNGGVAVDGMALLA